MTVGEGLHNDNEQGAGIVDIDQALSVVREVFVDGRLPDCGRILKEVEVSVKACSDVVRRKRCEEYVRYLQGLIQLKLGEHRSAMDLFEEALLCSQLLFEAGDQTPSRVCMEALKSRAISLLLHGTYPTAVRVFKEWLQLRDRFWPEMDATEVQYNLGMCYKRMFCFASALHWFKQVFLLAGKTSTPESEECVVRALDEIRTVEELTATPTEEEIRDDVTRISLPSKAGCSQDYFATKLPTLRAKIHRYLAQMAWGILCSRTASEHAAQTSARGSKIIKGSKWFGKLISDQLHYVAGFSNSPSHAHAEHLPKPSIEETRDVILHVATSLLCKIVGSNEDAVRKYLCEGASPQAVRLLGTPLKTAQRQALTFAAEFVTNFPGMHAWLTAQMQPGEGARQTLVNEFPPMLPFLSGDGAPGSEEDADFPGEYVIRFLCDAVENYEAYTEAARAVVEEQAPFTPRVSGLQGETALLGDAQREELCRALPSRHHRQHWSLVFSTRRDGFALSSFFQRGEDVGENVLVVETIDGDIFGGYSSGPWQPSKYYYGNGETMVFAWKLGAPDLTITLPSTPTPSPGSRLSPTSRSSTPPGRKAKKGPTFYAWQWTGSNRMFVHCDQHSFAFGGGATGPSFSIDGNNLGSGTSNPCESFNSPVLTSSHRFVIKCVECWTFHDEEE